MNKQTLVALAVIVALLAFWLLIALLYPDVEEVDLQPEPKPVEDMMDGEDLDAGTTGDLDATVDIVDDSSLLNRNGSEALDARVTITGRSSR